MTSTKMSKKFDINYKAVHAMRRCGKCNQCFRRFLALINHPPPMTENNYSKIADSMVDRLQNYYAIAIRSNVSDLPKM